MDLDNEELEKTLFIKNNIENKRILYTNNQELENKIIKDISYYIEHKDFRKAEKLSIIYKNIYRPIEHI